MHSFDSNRCLDLVRHCAGSCRRLHVVIRVNRVDERDFPQPSAEWDEGTDVVDGGMDRAMVVDGVAWEADGWWEESGKQTPKVPKAHGNLDGHVSERPRNWIVISTLA